MTPQNHNLYSHYQKQFIKFKNKPALRLIDNKTIYYKDLEKESAKIANYLRDLGVKIGDRVSVQVQKSPEALYLYLACLRAGFVYHPLNVGYKESELNYFFQNAEPSLVVCDQSNLEIITNLALENKISKVLTLNSDSSGSLLEESKKCASTFDTVYQENDDLAALLYSSGTTGTPKGIMLTHLNLSSNAYCLKDIWGFTDEDILLHALPIFHVHGLFVALGCVFLSGASTFWLDKFNQNEVLSALPKCTVMMGVPTYYTRLLATNQVNKLVTKNMRLFISGSAPLLTDTFVEFEQATGHCILERYGMTETNMSTSNPLEGKRKAGTVGISLPQIEIRITDNSGKLLDEGDIGNIQVRGPNVFKGYWRMPEKTSEDFTHDSYFNTGDKGIKDADGYISIVGRSKDMIITGGLNVYPKEVELVIDEIDGILESAVIGIPDQDFGEAVAALIVYEKNECNPEVEEILKLLKEKISNFKVPKQIVPIDELPRNTMGKVQKNILRDSFVMLNSKSS